MTTVKSPLNIVSVTTKSPILKISLGAIGKGFSPFSDKLAVNSAIPVHFTPANFFMQAKTPAVVNAAKIFLPFNGNSVYLDLHTKTAFALIPVQDLCVNI